MDKPLSLANHFLIAMPGKADEFFSHSVILVCRHDSEGAMGVMINRPTNLSVSDILEQMKTEPFPDALRRQPVFSGGPVHTERGLVLHEGVGDWEYTLPVSRHLGLTTSQDILQAMAERSGPDKTLVALGYASRGEGQLEEEILRNSWLHLPADHDLMFHTPMHKRWKEAGGRIGVDLDRLLGDIGHA